MNADVNVRKMSLSDFPGVTEIDQALFGQERLPTWPFPFEVYWREYRPDIRFVAETEGRLIGFIVGCLVVEDHNRSVLNLRHLGDKPRPSREVGWIDMIGVLPGSQHAGIGHMLVDAFCAECRFEKVEVRAVASEQDAKLRRFLEASGFEARDFVIYEKNA